jgi:hypothetical protein
LQCRENRRNMAILVLLQEGQAMKAHKQVEKVSPAVSAAGTMMADAMLFWADQFMAQQRLAGAVLDSYMQWGKDVEAGLAEIMMLPGSQDMHITPDSAGVALSSMDPSPKGIVDAFAGTANAMFQAWANAIEHEMQDAQGQAPEPAQRH